jgi:sugar lactone lactonase YvrE
MDAQTAIANKPTPDATGEPELAFVGQGLSRPECVLATRAGNLYTSDWRGGITQIAADGAQTSVIAQPVDGIAIKPNGIALQADGTFLLAHLGEREGGVFRLARDGSARPWLTAADGVDLPPTNFVTSDAMGRVWVTVSTRLKPRAAAYNGMWADGFIVCVPEGQTESAFIAASGLGYTNEVAVHPNGRWLYVNETFGRVLSRFEIHADGRLGNKEVVTEFGHGAYPDGLAFDANGDAWVVSIVSNRVIRVDGFGKQTVYLQDAEPTHVDWVEAAFQAGQMGRPHLDGVRSQLLRNISSIAFCGANLRHAALGCLLGTQIVTLPMPVAGHPPPHWTFE